MTFTWANGTFAESGTDTVKLAGLRVSAEIVKAGGASLGSLQLRLWGMTRHPRKADDPVVPTASTWREA